jgi:SagB-type dehydrogenase family enzyme
VERQDSPREHTFFYRSFYEPQTLSDPTWRTPERYKNLLPVKTYEHAQRYPLHTYPALSIGDARWSFSAFRDIRQTAPLCEGLDDASLSTLLYYTYGVSRFDQGSGALWRFHRFVPSARCLFPTELYFCLPQTGRLAAGLYHYDPLHHCLSGLRRGNYLPHLAASLGADLEGALGVLLISSMFSKMAAFYRDFAYRLCTQEAGILIGNAALVAAALGLQGQIHYQFPDQELNQLCGLSASDEALLATITLFPWLTIPLGTMRSRSAQRPSKHPAALHLSHLRWGMPEPETYATLLDFHAQTCRTTGAEPPASQVLQSDVCDANKQRVPLSPPQTAGVELADALRRRSSGDVDFVSQARLMPRSVCSEILRYALQPYTSDLRNPAGVPGLELFVCVNTIEGVESGIYRLCVTCGMLHVIALGDQAQHVQALQTQANINATSANLLCFLVGNYADLHHRFGDRAYRLLHLEAGLVAHRICVMSATHGVVARYANSVHVPSVLRLLHLSDWMRAPVAEVVIGYERPGAGAAQRYRRSLCG